MLDLNLVVAGVEGMLRRLISEDVALDRDLNEHPMIVFADRRQLEQVLMNLAVNAGDAMPRGGRILVRTSQVSVQDSMARELGLRPGPHVLLTFTDTGSGMSEETRSRVFEPFFASPPLRPTGKGFGERRPSCSSKTTNGCAT